MCFLFHKWEKWEQYIEGGVTVLTGILTPKELRGAKHPFSEKRQKRSCLKCGKQQDELVC